MSNAKSLSNEQIDKLDDYGLRVAFDKIWSAGETSPPPGCRGFELVVALLPERWGWTAAGFEQECIVKIYEVVAVAGGCITSGVKSPLGQAQHKSPTIALMRAACKAAIVEKKALRSKN